MPFSAKVYFLFRSEMYTVHTCQPSQFSKAPPVCHCPHQVSSQGHNSPVFLSISDEFSHLFVYKPCVNNAATPDLVSCDARDVTQRAARASSSPASERQRVQRDGNTRAKLRHPGKKNFCFLQTVLRKESCTFSIKHGGCTGMNHHREADWDGFRFCSVISCFMLKRVSPHVLFYFLPFVSFPVTAD